MTDTIPQTDPGAACQACRTELDAAIRRVLDGGRYILGEEVRAFEREFAAWLGGGHAVGVASGTDALHLALCACGIGPGDEVVTVSHTAVATVAAIERCGATPVLAEVDPETYTLAPDALAAAVTPRTRAVVPVHLYGMPADMAAILPLARTRGLRVIEDCAQAHGAACRLAPGAAWRKVGTLGDLAAFSFYPTKNLGALGDGGCVTTGDAALAERVRQLREYGWRERYVSEVRGWNSRLDEIQAAVLRVKLRRLDDWNGERRRLAAIYDRLLADRVNVPAQRPDRMHAFHQYVLRLPERDRVRAALARAGIGAGIHYPVPIHCQPAYRTPGTGARLALTEKLAAEVLSLPMYPQLGAAAAERVAREVLRALAA